MGTNTLLTVQAGDSKPMIRDAKGRFVPGVNQAPNPITQANARSLALRRAEKARKASASRVLAEAMSIDPSIATEADAIALLTARHYMLMMDSDKPRVDDLAKLRDMLTGTDMRQADTVAEVQHTYTIDDATRELLRRLAGMSGQSLDIITVIPSEAALPAVAADEEVE